MKVITHDCRPPKHKGLWDRKQQRHNGEIWACHCGRKFRGRVYAHPSGWRLVWHPLSPPKTREVNLSLSLKDLIPQGRHRAAKIKKMVFDVPR